MCLASPPTESSNQPTIIPTDLPSINPSSEIPSHTPTITHEIELDGNYDTIVSNKARFLEDCSMAIPVTSFSTSPIAKDFVHICRADIRL